MRWKTTVVLLFATIAVGSYVSLYELKQPTPGERERLSNRVVQIEPEDVTRLEVRFPSADVALEPQHGIWRLTKPVTARADQGLVKSLLIDLNPLQAKRILTGSNDQPLAREQFGLNPPRGTLTVETAPSAESGAKSAASGAKTTTLLFGEQTAVGGDRYVALADSPNIFIIGGHAYDVLDRAPDAYRSHELFTFEPEQAARVTVASTDHLVTLAKSANQWYVIEPVQDLAEPRLASTLLSQLRKLQIARFLNDQPPAEPLPAWGFQAPHARLSVELHDGTALPDVLIGNPTSDNPQQRYVKRTDESNVYGVAADNVEQLLYDPQAFRSRKLFDITVGQVTKAQVDWEGRSWTVERADGEEVFYALRDLTLTRFIEDEPEDLARYGLEPPRGMIQAWLDGQAEPIRLRIGEIIQEGRARYGYLEGRPAIVELPEAISDLLQTPTVTESGGH